MVVQSALRSGAFLRAEASASITKGRFVMARTVRCGVHGTQQETFVCQHITAGLIEGQRTGFHTAMDDQDNLRPDAWCRACNDRVALTGGRWVGEALAQLDARVICGACYDLARTFHRGADRRTGS